MSALSILVAILFSIFGFVLFLLWLWMLVDCLTNEPNSGYSKLIWGVVVFFLYPVGAIVYYVLRRPERIKWTGQ